MDISYNGIAALFNTPNGGVAFTGVSESNAFRAPASYYKQDGASLGDTSGPAQLLQALGLVENSDESPSALFNLTSNDGSALEESATAALASVLMAQGLNVSPAATEERKKTEEAQKKKVDEQEAARTAKLTAEAQVEARAMINAAMATVHSLEQQLAEATTPGEVAELITLIESIISGLSSVGSGGGGGDGGVGGGMQAGGGGGGAGGMTLAGGTSSSVATGGTPTGTDTATADPSGFDETHGANASHGNNGADSARSESDGAIFANALNAELKRGLPAVIDALCALLTQAEKKYAKLQEDELKK